MTKQTSVDGDVYRLLRLGGRQSGRTQLMIDELISAVVDGQPRSRVVAHSMDFALHHLLPRVADALRARGLGVAKPRQNVLVVEGEQEIEFTVPSALDDWQRRGSPDIGDFWDHLADGIE